MTILDQHGRPFQPAQLREPQTARIAGLSSEFAGHPSRGLTPSKLAAILEEAERGSLTRQAELGLDMEEKDGHIHAELSKRRRALLGLEWEIIPPRNPSAAEQRAAEDLAERVQDVADLEDVILDLGDGIGHGYACLEYEWERLGRDWRPASITHRPATWFTTPPDAQNELRLRDGSMTGEALQPFGWLAHTHRAKPGYVTRGGLHRVLAWPYLFKNYSVRDLAEFLEIYGLPLRLGTYPAGAGDTEKATLLRAVVAIGHAAAGIIPEGMKIDFQEAAKGASDPFLAMIDWCERTQSKAILGQTLSAEASATGLGSGVASLQGEVRRDILISDARQIAGTLTRDLLYPLAALNGLAIDPRRMPRWIFITDEPEDIKLYSEALPKLVDAGVRIPERWARERLKIPEATAGEAILQRPAGAAPTGQPGAALRREVAALATITDPSADPLADRLQLEAAGAMRDWLERIRAMVEAAPNLAALRDQLLAAYGDLPTERLAAVMRTAFAAADLAGRYDVASEVGQIEG